MKTIYDLKLHESVFIKQGLDDFKITRVPGGWIYRHIDNSVFVPFNNEFQ